MREYRLGKSCLMMERKIMLELLAPAGSVEALRAAVQNGANAVYLGCGPFNARQSAKNFTPQMLAEAVKYCHIRGVAVHLTLNTLVSDKEIWNNMLFGFLQKKRTVRLYRQELQRIIRNSFRKS